MHDNSSGSAGSEVEELVGDGTPPAGSQIQDLSPDQIRPNPANPRHDFFDDATIEGLAESIDAVGVLQPITVYEDVSEDGTTHVLLDGERRLRACKRINRRTIPAFVIPKPSGVQNTLRMFNIHMLREQWPNLAVAWAVKHLMEETGQRDVRELHRLTGVSMDLMTNIMAVLRFPDEIQERVKQGDLPFNLLVEIDKNLLRFARKDPKVVLDYDQERLWKTFIQKYESGVLDDVVEMRRVADLVRAIKAGGDVGDRAARAFRELVETPEASVSDAYDAGAAASLELSKLLNRMYQFPLNASQLLASEIGDEQRTRLVEGLRRLRREIDGLIEAADQT